MTAAGPPPPIEDGAGLGSDHRLGSNGDELPLPQMDQFNDGGFLSGSGAEAACRTSAFPSSIAFSRVIPITNDSISCLDSFSGLVAYAKRRATPPSGRSPNRYVTRFWIIAPSSSAIVLVLSLEEPNLTQARKSDFHLFAHTARSARGSQPRGADLQSHRAAPQPAAFHESAVDRTLAACKCESIRGRHLSASRGTGSRRSAL
jgi:hypothetical protein